MIVKSLISTVFNTKFENSMLFCLHILGFEYEQSLMPDELKMGPAVQADNEAGSFGSAVALKGTISVGGEG